MEADDVEGAVTGAQALSGGDPGAPTGGFKPTIPPIVRTVIYVAGLAWGFVSTIAVGSVAVFWPDQAKDILAVMGSISGGFSFLAGATGVAFRPTRQVH